MGKKHIERVWLAPKQAAQHIGVAYRTLLEWRQKAKGPRYSSVTGNYDLVDLERWIAAHYATGTHQRQSKRGGYRPRRQKVSQGEPAEQQPSRSEPLEAPLVGSGLPKILIDYHLKNR